MVQHPNVEESNQVNLELWFFKLQEGTKLLDCFRQHEHLKGQRLMDQLRQMLKLIKDRWLQCEQHCIKNGRISWREDRIELYDNLLLLVLGAGG